MERNKKVQLELEQQLIPGLPDELGLHILARAPRSCHHVMKLVSKMWYSTMNGDQIFTLRRQLGVTEQWLYFVFLDKGGNFCASLDLHGAWRRLPPIPSTPSLLTSLAELNGCLYAIGRGRSRGDGDDPRINLRGTASVFRYCPRTNRWTVVAPMTTPRVRPQTGVVNGLLYAVGGDRKDHFDTAEVYNPATDSWTRIASMNLRPADRYTSMHMVTWAGRLWVTWEGQHSRGGQVYDPVTDTWGVMPRGMQSEPGLSKRVVVEGGRLLSFYGENGVFLVKEYDAEEDCWRLIATLVEDRTKSSFLYRVCAWNGDVYVVDFVGWSLLRADCVCGKFIRVSGFGRFGRFGSVFASGYLAVAI